MSLPLVFVFFCVAEVVSVLSMYLFHLNFTVSIFLSSMILLQIAFGGSIRNTHGLASIMSHMTPQKTTNVHGLFMALGTKAISETRSKSGEIEPNRSAGRGLFRKGVVRFSHSKPREPKKHDENLKTIPL